MEKQSPLPSILLHLLAPPPYIQQLLPLRVVMACAKGGSRGSLGLQLLAL